MKKQSYFNERGQALVMVALAIVGLFGFAALAIDGSAVFSDRRHSQNASDTSAVAAALARVRPDTSADGTWQTYGFDRATDNGYTNGGQTQVDIFTCQELEDSVHVVDGFTLDCDGLPDGADPSQYVYVHIKSVVRLFFARIIGRSEVTNHTEAVARASLPEETRWYDGYAIASTTTSCANNVNPLELGGSARVRVTGSGLYVNANCPGRATFVVNGGESFTTDGVCIVSDTLDAGDNFSPATRTNCPPVDFSNYQLPNPICEHEGSIQEDPDHPNEYTAYPGWFDDEFPSHVDGVGNGGVLKLQRGIYCLFGGMNINAGWTVSDMDGVLFVLDSDNAVTIEGGATVTLRAVSSTQYGFPESLVNYLFYAPPNFSPTIRLSGNSGSSYTGTILVPSANLVLQGNSDSLAMDCKIIANTVAMTGNGLIDLTYSEENNAITHTNPQISLIN